MSDVPEQMALRAQKNAQDDKRRAVAMLWYAGHVAWKLDKVQKELYASYKNSTAKTIVWSCSRRLGKSYALCVLAVETCLNKPNAVVKFIAPTQKHVRSIVRPLLKEIVKDCPIDIKPDYHVSDNAFRFKNGSEIQLAGTDGGHAESLRGGSSDLCIIDEAGFCDDLKYIVQSILVPTTTTTRGKIILSSTPPKSADHEFESYRKTAEFKGNYVMKTIYDGIGARITQEIIDEIVEELGGLNSPDFRREYMCITLQDPEHSVVPEFTPEMQLEVVKEWPKPAFCDRYVSGDIGFKDLTVFLFAYFDFKANKVVIEDELVMSGREMTTEALAKGIKTKEERLWTDVTGEVLQPYLRVCDNNLIVINDLERLHGLTVIPTAKDDKQAAINNLRVMLKEGKLIIHPRCKTLIYHMRNATWAKSKRIFDRSPDAGHYDALDSAIYLVRNIVYSRNPFPASFEKKHNEDRYYTTTNKPLTPIQNQIKGMFIPNKYRGLGRFNK